MSDRKPVLIELDANAPRPDPASAPAVPEIDGRAMQTVAVLTAKRGSSKMARWFWAALGTVVSIAVGIWAYDAAVAIWTRVPILGYVLAAALAVLLLCVIVYIIREIAAILRLSRIDRIQSDARGALAAADRTQASQVVDKLTALYRGRDDVAWGQAAFDQRRGDLFDADSILGAAEQHILAPLDAAALREVEASARQVATVTALIPIAFADVFAALTANVRMIRRIAMIYGGRAGTLGSWRLMRAVMTHLIATGAVAIGDDMLGSVAGGGLLSKVSRRFGEGLINGALTARVGIATIEVCRPLPRVQTAAPTVGAVIARALRGVVASD